MLRNVVFITTDAGIPIFTKEFVNPVPQPRMICALLLTMIKQCTLKIGSRVSHVEMENVAATIVIDNNSKLACVVFHDVEDGHPFGKLLASEMLLSFVKEFDQIIKAGGLASAGGKLLAFHSKIPEVFRNSVRPILEKLKQQRGISSAMLVSNGKVMHSTSNAFDRLSLVANLQVLISHSTDLMNSASDLPRSLRLEGETTNIQIIQADQLTHLVVLCRKNVDQSLTDAAIADAVGLLRKVYSLIANTQNSKFFS